ncbi:MAG: sialidase family protein [Bacteroidota bacterium]
MSLINQSILSISILLFCLSCSPPKNILIYENKLDSYGPCEPSIIINPKNPDNIIAGSVLNFYHYSFDGGKTWTTEQLQSPLGVYGDPCVAADADGNVYYLHLGDPEGTGWESKRMLESIVIQRSADGGKTWNEGSAIGTNPPKQQDKEWIAINPANQHLYVSWTQFDRYGDRDPNCKTHILFSQSTDLGENWTKPIILSQFPGNCIDDDNTVEGAVPAVGPNGEIYVAWGYEEKLFFDKSTDGGINWLQEDLIVAQQPGGWDMDIPGLGRSNGMPVTAVDLSDGPHRGTIYVNWADLRNGPDNCDIFLAYSTDDGQNWSAPIKVNQDESNRHQFLPWMSVDPSTGYIYIVYYDRSRHDDLQTDVVVAVSKDGGRHFKNSRISQESFVPPGKDVFFGDYNNISAYNGRVRPIWTVYKNGYLSIWTALIQ